MAIAAGYSTMHYTKMFGIADFGKYRQLFYLNGNDTQWSLRSDSLKDKKPSIAVMASVFAGFIETLDKREAIVAVDNMLFYSDTILISMMKSGIVQEVGEEAQLNTEKLIRMKPDLIIGSSVLSGNKTIAERFRKSGIILLTCENYKEQHPLARAEWIRFFGFILGCESKADSIFNDIEKSYNAQLKSVKSSTAKPKVLTDAMYLDAWNIPGGKSYTARLIEDAGGEYVFAHKQEMYTYPMNLESVIKSASNADVWIHVNRFKTKAEMLSADPRYTFFRAFNQGRVFNNNKRENANGGNDFWEMGPVRPDLILSDLIAIFSQDKISDDKLYFYTRVD